MNTHYIIIGFRDNGKFWTDKGDGNKPIFYEEKEKAQERAKIINDNKHNGINKCRAVSIYAE